MSTISPHVSRSRLDEIGMGDPSFTAELIDIMLEDGNSRVHMLRQAYEAQEMESVGKLAHSLKGAALNVGANALADLCASIDDTARKLRILVEASRIEALEQEFAHVSHELLTIKSELTR
ncbi:Hpt domain-containing protein [bacterium]|nr:Hpt domain-containing protein [bacterium]